MPRTKKKARSSKVDDDDWAPPSSARHRPSVKMPVSKREQRHRNAPKAFTPTAGSPTRRPPRKQKDSSPSVESNSAVATPRPEHQRLERKIKSQAHRLRYPLAFVEAYEAQGWRNTSRDKLKPNKELQAAHRKIENGQQALSDGLRELQALKANEPEVPPLAAYEDVHCSRCGSTDVEQGNDILLCDSVGCHRAYHQKCQTPIVLTENIPAGADPWFCEVCLAVFECLKVINSAFGTTYETVDDLFPEQQAVTDGSNNVQSGDENQESGNAPADEDDDEEDDEDFVCNDEDEGDEEESSDEQPVGVAGENEEELTEEVPETADDLKYLTSDDVIDANHRSMRSKTIITPKEQKRSDLVGELVAKVDRVTKQLVIGVIAEFQPPTSGKHSRWRADYRDGTTELLTGQKVKGALARAAQMNDSENGDDVEGDSTLIVHGKRKRNQVDYRQLNELMFAGKDEDSDDETFEVKSDEDANEEEEVEGDEQDEEEEEEEGEEQEEDKDDDKKGEDMSDNSSPTTVSQSHDEVSQTSSEKRSRREHPHVDYLSMHEGLLNPC